MDEISFKLERDLKKISNGDFGLFIIEENRQEEARDTILNYLLKKFKSGIYVSFDKNLEKLRKIKGKYKSKNNLYLCGINSGVKLKKEESFFAEKPSFVELSLLFQNLVNSGKYDFIYLESLSSLLRYYDPSAVARFLNYLIEHNKLVMLQGVGSSEDSEATSILMPHLNGKCIIFEAVGQKDNVVAGLGKMQNSELDNKKVEDILYRFRSKFTVPENTVNLKNLPSYDFQRPYFQFFLFISFLLIGVFLLYPRQDVLLSPGNAGSEPITVFVGFLFLIAALIAALLYALRKYM